jgi:hypothetical protein
MRDRKLQIGRTVWLLVLALFAVFALLTSSAAQDKPGDQPDVLKKKARPPDKPAPEKPVPDAKEKDKDDRKDAKSGKDKDEPDGPDPAKVAKEIFERINKNIRSAEERLKAQDAGDGTQQIQRDVVKDLDSLIEQLKKQQEQQQQQQQQQQAGAGGGGSSKGQSGGGGGASKQRGSRQGRGSGQGQGSQKGGNQQGNGDQSAKGNGQKGQPKGQGGPGGQGSAGGGMGGNSPISANKLADLYKDIWGHLPEDKRQEIDAYQKEGYMTKYRELLKLYYATIAEKGRRADERERRTGEADR